MNRYEMKVRRNEVAPSILPPSVAVLSAQNRAVFEAEFPVRSKILAAFSNEANPPSRLDEWTYIQWLRLANNIAAFSHNRRESGQVLYGRQLDVYEDTGKSIERGDIGGVIQAPTGFGKGVLTTQIVRAANVPTLILVPRKGLVEEMYNKFGEYCPEIEVGRVYQDVEELGRQVTISTYQTLTSDKSRRYLHPDGVKLLVVDEQQESVGRKRIETIEAIDEFEGAYILGLSATPVEIEDPNFRDTRMGKISRNLIHSISIVEGAEEGYSASFTTILVQSDVDLTDVKRSDTGDYDEDELDKRINTLAHNMGVVGFYQQAKAKDIAARTALDIPLVPFTTIGFTRKVTHAQKLAEVFNRAGIPAAAVWGTQNKDERRRIIQQWRNGEIEVVFNSKLFVKGTDIKEIRTVLNIAPTASLEEIIQRTGRGSRLNERDPYKHLLVADFVYPDRRARQVTYSQAVRATRVARKHIAEARKRTYYDAAGEDLGEFNIEGLRVTTRQKEVLTVLSKMAEGRFQVAPESWMIIADIGSLIGRSESWVMSHLQDAIDLIQKEREQEGNPVEEQETLSGEFINHQGQRTFRYSPNVAESLKQLSKAEETRKAPEGWLGVGDKHRPGTISGEVKRTQVWIDKNIKVIIAQIQRELDEKEVPSEDRKPTHDQFFSAELKRLVWHYSPEVIERLKQYAKRDHKAARTQQLKEAGRGAPEGWMVIASQPGDSATISARVGRSSAWIKAHLADVIAEIQIEREEQGTPINEQEPLHGRFPSFHRPGNFYAPEITQKLKAIADAEPKAEAGWKVLGPGTGTLVESIGRSDDWIRVRVSKILTYLNRQDDEKNVPEEKRVKHVQMALNSRNVSSTFYSHYIENVLKQMANQEDEKNRGSNSE